MIEAYLRAVREALGPGRGERFLAEIHDHLLESVADGLEKGLTPEAAEARAIERCGPPELVAGMYAAELAAAMWEKHMQTLRLIGAAFALLTLYYARFFLAVRQETATLVQIGILLIAAAILLVPIRRRAIQINPWLTGIIAVGLAVAFFAWADHDSHSVSDTLNRSVPTLCLIAAIALRVAYRDRQAARLT
jgi:hypothetical protein